MSNLIEGIGLTKLYDDFVLDHVDICIPAGHVVGLVGSNGSGKTTAIKSLLGLLRLDDGTVKVFGEAPADASWKERVGVVFDTCSFVPSMRISDVARMGSVAYERWDGDEFKRLVNGFGISMRKEVKSLSRGMGMKLSLAFALAHHPDLLILDEPTAGLDPVARDEALDLMRAFMADEGKGILISSHITSDLEKIADCIVCIDKGRIAFAEAKDDICDKAGIAHCREDQFAAVLQDAQMGEHMRFVRRDFQIDVLVRDRFAFAEGYPDVLCDAATIEEYMLMMLKGGAR